MCIRDRQEYELRIYRHIIPALGEIPLNKLTEANLQQFYHQLKHDGRLNRTDLYGPGLSDRSVRGCHITCRAALAQAVEEGPIPVNPAEGCKLPGGRTPGDAGADPGGDAAPFDSGQGGRPVSYTHLLHRENCLASQKSFFPQDKAGLSRNLGCGQKQE